MSLLRALWLSMRPYQWTKSAFVFTGLVFGHAWTDLDLALRVSAAAVAFSWASSGIYIFNDLCDLKSDREHPVKKLRPIAAGQLSPAAAWTAAALLWAGGLGLGAWASSSAAAFLLVYVVAHWGYSLGLKNVVILDVFIIAFGFMLRILAGTVGVGIPPSQWLLLCGFMLALFLGVVKRRAEIARSRASAGREVLRDYNLVILDKMIGITSSSVIITYSLYTMSPETIRTHGTESAIYTVPFVLYCVFRYIYLLHRQDKGSDPAADLMRDPHILASASLWLATFLWLITP